MIVLNSGGLAMILDDDGALTLTSLPSLRDGTLQELVQVIDTLPQHVCLLFDRETGDGRVLRVNDAGLPDFIEDREGRARAALRASDHAGGKVREPADNEPHPQDTRLKDGYLLLIARHDSLPGLTGHRPG